MKSIYHEAGSRGHQNHGWLDTYHSFSFADYFNRERMNFGVLRVLNDDCIKGGQGFGMHPHENMEIFTLPLKGSVAHRDSMGNSGIISYGEVQVMSAGTGILHSEFNANATEELRLLQIWVYPRESNLEPRYDQLTLDWENSKNLLFQILSPKPNDPGVWINQDAWFSLAVFDAGKTFSYNLNLSGNGIYIFVIEGNIEVGGHSLNKRDGLGLWELAKADFDVKSDSVILIMEVPMELSHKG